jgi:NAD(P)-dependent dehydrogenase (short-subunit alcohol dehydrogenase family)
VDGYEKTLQVDHLAPFLLTELLLPALVAGGAVVIQTAGRAAQVFSRLDLDDLQNARGYAPHRTYGNGKLANILFTQELQRRYGDQGVSAVAFHPGVVGTSFAGETNYVLPGACYEKRTIATWTGREIAEPRYAHELWERSSAMV